MIIFTETKVYPLISMRGYYLFNFLSKAMIGEDISPIFPGNEVLNQAQYDENMFEQFYTGWLLNNPKAFISFMSMMMGNYYGEHAVVFTDFNYNIIQNVVDCLIKFIRERYGLKAIIADSIEDITKADDSSMTPEGAQRFMADKEWYTLNTVDVDVLKDNLETVEQFNADI